MTCIIAAAIFTAQKLAQQEFNSIKFHYSEKGNSAPTSEISSHKTCRTAQEGQKRNELLGRVGGCQCLRVSCPGHCDTSARESSSLRECASFLPTSAPHGTGPALPAPT